MTICIDEQSDHPTEFLIYGYIILTSTSHLLQKLFSNKAARKMGIVLHDVKPDILKRYVDWLHFRKLWAQKDDEKMSYAQLIDLYFLGELVEDPVFSEVVVDALIDMRFEVEDFDGRPTRPLPGCAFMNDVWERTSSDSPLRKVMRELWMSALVTKAMKFLTGAPEPGYPKDLILDLLAGMVDRMDCEGATFSGKSRKEVEETCRGFMEGIILRKVSGV